MAMVRQIADWVIVMAEGKLVAEGEPDVVLKNPAVVDAYLGSHQDIDLGAVTGRIPLPGGASSSSKSPQKK
jgi:branched-chain amino acid transport system ATP-binding protein